MDLCGHATLATAHCIFKELNYKKKVIFETMSGRLAEKVDHYYQMTLPSRQQKNKSSRTNFKFTQHQTLEVYKSRDYYYLRRSKSC